MQVLARFFGIGMRDARDQIPTDSITGGAWPGLAGSGGAMRGWASPGEELLPLAVGRETEEKPLRYLRDDAQRQRRTVRVWT